MDITERLDAVVRERRVYEASKKPAYYNPVTSDWLTEASEEIRYLRGVLLVAHGALMKATGGDIAGTYADAVGKIRSALGAADSNNSSPGEKL